jgi:hypothetical protein
MLFSDYIFEDERLFVSVVIECRNSSSNSSVYLFGSYQIVELGFGDISSRFSVEFILEIGDNGNGVEESIGADEDICVR